MNSGFLWAAKCKGIYIVFLIHFVFFKFFILNKYYFCNKNKSRNTNCLALALQFTSLHGVILRKRNVSSFCPREIRRAGHTTEINRHHHRSGHLCY